MSSLYMKNVSVGVIDIGVPVVLIKHTGRIRPYDDRLGDAVEDIVGVVSPLKGNAGRTTLDGTIFYLNDHALWNANLTVKLDEKENPLFNNDYKEWDAVQSLDEYSVVTLQGIAAVLDVFCNVPKRWLYLGEHKDMYKWYYVR